MSQKIVIFVNWTKKEGKIHKTTCHHARKHTRLWDEDLIVDENGASWWGPYNTYTDARKKVDQLSFKIWKCSHCKPN